MGPVVDYRVVLSQLVFRDVYLIMVDPMIAARGTADHGNRLHDPAVLTIKENVLDHKSTESAVRPIHELDLFFATPSASVSTSDALPVAATIVEPAKNGSRFLLRRPPGMIPPALSGASATSIPHCQELTTAGALGHFVRHDEMMGV